MRSMKNFFYIRNYNKISNLKTYISFKVTDFC